jgi:hypothetical protein
VGAEEVTLAGLISSYRTQRGGSEPIVLAVPSLLLNTIAWIGDRIPSLPVGSETLAMLASGNTGNGERFIQLLGRTPINHREFLHAQ